MSDWSNTASVAQLATPITAGATSCTVSSFTGWPAASSGIWAIIARGTASAEIVLITAIAGSTLTIARGQDGTAAFAHGAGDNLEHIAPANFFLSAELHQVATTGVHGASGSVVGTTGNQTIQDKTFRGAHKSTFSDALPAGVTISYESTADNATARDGFVHKNTGTADVLKRGFMLEQSGTPRFEVFNDGKVKLSATATPGLENDGTTQLDGALTANAAATFNGAVTAASTLTVTGALTANGTVDLNGATTLDGAVTASSTFSVKTLTTQATQLGDTDTRVTINTRGGTKALEVFNEVPTSVASIDGEGDLVLAGAATLTSLTATSAISGSTVGAVSAVTAYGGRVLVTVTSLASVTSPTTGQLAFLTTDKLLYVWNGSAWVPLFTSSQADPETDSGTTTSTTYTATLTGGTTPGVVFTAPFSGKVKVHVTCQQSNSTSGAYTFSSPQIREGSTIGSGTIAFAADDSNALTWNSTTVAGRVTVSKTFPGLTPGALYNAQMLFKVGAGTGTFVRKSIEVDSLLA